MCVCFFQLDGRGGVLSEETTFRPDLHDIKEQALSRFQAGEGRGASNTEQEPVQRQQNRRLFFCIFWGQS